MASTWRSMRRTRRRSPTFISACSTGWASTRIDSAPAAGRSPAWQPLVEGRILATLRSLFLLGHKLLHALAVGLGDVQGPLRIEGEPVRHGELAGGDTL